MLVEVSRVEQVFSIEDQTFRTFIVFELPGVGDVRAEVATDDASRLMRGVAKSKETKKVAAVQHGHVPTPEPHAEDSGEEEAVRWSDLSEDFLPEDVKQLIRRTGAPAMLKPSELVQLISEFAQHTPTVQQATEQEEEEELDADEDGVAQL